MGETNVTDRRIERANRTRDNVVDALLALIEEGNLRPTAREIASRAGVSLRSLYVHFDDVEALFHAAAIRHGVRVQETWPELRTTGSFEERLAAFLDRRLQHYESDRNVRQAALLQEPFSPALHSILESAREAGRAELDKVFAPELAGPDVAERRAALDVVTHPASWKVVRSQHGLDMDAARSLVAGMVRDVLGQDHPRASMAPTAEGNGRKAARKT